MYARGTQHPSQIQAPSSAREHIIGICKILTRLAQSDKWLLGHFGVRSYQDDSGHCENKRRRIDAAAQHGENQLQSIHDLQKLNPISHIFRLQEQRVIDQATNTFTDTQFLLVNVDDAPVFFAPLRPFLRERQKVGIVREDDCPFAASIFQLRLIAQTQIARIARRPCINVTKA